MNLPQSKNEKFPLTTAAILYEVRKLSEIGMSLKFRFYQTDDLEKREIYLKKWNNINNKKEFLKVFCRENFNKGSKKKIRFVNITS